MTILGTMKVTDIQDKQGYSLITFEIPDDCKQFLIEHAIRDLLTKAAEETKQKYGSVLPETAQTLDKQTGQVYNEYEADDEGWIPNRGKQPVADGVRVDTKWAGGFVEHRDMAGDWGWSDTDLLYWRLSKTE